MAREIISRPQLPLPREDEEHFNCLSDFDIKCLAEGTLLPDEDMLHIGKCSDCKHRLKKACDLLQQAKSPG
jgi:hypothetical protein